LLARLRIAAINSDAQIEQTRKPKLGRSGGVYLFQLFFDLRIHVLCF
jgi:hypothetical protein